MNDTTNTKNNIQNYLNNTEMHKRLPFYFALTVYVFKYYKFPYYMSIFPRKKLSIQIIYLAIGKITIDVLFNLYRLTNK